MLLDKIKSLFLSIGFGLTATTFTSFAGFKIVAARHSVAFSDALTFARRQPLSNWPTDLMSAAALALIAGVCFSALLWWPLRNVCWTYRPRSLVSDEATAELLAKGTPKQKPRIFAGKFGGKPLHVSIEDRGLVIGPPGTGKTAFLLNQVLRATHTGLSFAVVDLKPELHKILAPSLKATGYRVLRVNPARIDPAADHWNPLDDIEDETDITELCASLLPIRDAKEAPFVEAQRDWLKAAVFHVKSQPGGNLPAAFNRLSAESNPANLLDILTRSPNPTAARIARRIAAGLAGSKPDPLILQGLTGCLRTLDYLGLPGVQSSLGHSDFSARELGKGSQPVALFLQFEEAKINALGPLLAFMATGLFTALIDTAGRRQPVALFLDELGNMPPIPGLAEKLNTIRSRHIPTWMYFQTAEQIERRYGKGAAAIFFASADVQMVFRLNDHETRKLISDLVGTTERENPPQSASAGIKGAVNKSKERVNVIEPHELGQLAPGQVVCLYRGASAKGRATPHYVDFPQFKRNP